MSLSFGGVAFLSARTHVSELAAMFLGKSHIKSIFCLLIFVIVVLLLAYLTNPSETSFRAYLTEQSFRLHLSNLDDHIDEKGHGIEDSSKEDRTHLVNGDLWHRSHAASFHFAKRASISLRTPKHVFHNFGVFTIAAMIPAGKGLRRGPTSPDHHLPYRDATSLIADSWYIGAFGRWWRGGIIEAWYRDLIARSSDEESWSSGILGMKSLDQFHDECNGLLFASKASPSQDSAPKLRGRDKQSQNTPSRTRSQSPPPLPPSATLPFHTTHQDLTPLVIPSNTVSPVVSAQPPPQPSDPAPLTADPAPAISKTPSTGLFDQSPLIAEVLRQISDVKVSLQDVRTQLNDHQSSASLSHSTLQSEVDSLRERKREEDLARLDLKSRTKALDDSRRSVEGCKREAEKRLKVTRIAQDDISRCAASLSKDIHDLRKQCEDDERRVRQRKQSKGVSETEIEVSEAIEEKRKEIKAAEEDVATLALRAKQLEEKLTSERERLKGLKTRAENERQASHLFSSQSAVGMSRDDSCSFFAHGLAPSPILEHPAGSVGLLEFSSPVPREPSSYRPYGGMSLSLGPLSNFHGFPPSIGHANGQPALAEDFVPLLADEHPTTTFSPFSDPDIGLGPGLPSPYDPQSPITPGLIPSGLISTLDSAPPISRSFQSESDVVVNKEWRNHLDIPQLDFHGHVICEAPRSLRSSAMLPLPFNNRFVGMDSEAEICPVSAEGSEHHAIPRQRHSLPHPHRAYSDPPSLESNLNLSWESAPSESVDGHKFGLPRRWFSTSSKDKPKKGLNPDAKVFSLQKTPHANNLPTAHPIGAIVNTPHHGFDILNPNGLSLSSVSSVAADTSLFSRAFAPSRAEREALQRALGSSSNSSLDRLPSLSDVGSIPSSPNHAHATATSLNGSTMIGIGTNNISNIPSPHRSFPSWLQSLPRVRKPNFSPWDDDEATPDVAGVRSK